MAAAQRGAGRAGHRVVTARATSHAHGASGRVGVIRGDATHLLSLVPTAPAGLADGFTQILAGCATLLRPGGVVVVTARPWRKHGELVDLPSAVIGAGVRAGAHPGRSVRRAACRRPRRPAGGPAALPRLRVDGSVTFITAASARAALPGTAGLAAINGALEAMVRPLAAELAPLRINAVSPGIIDTPWWDGVPADQREVMFREHAAVLPVRRVGQPEDVAKAVLLTATNGFMTGTTIECAGGLHLAVGR